MISAFQEELNDRKTKVMYYTEIVGNRSANTKNNGSVARPKISRKSKNRIKKGVRLSSKYCAACR